VTSCVQLLLPFLSWTKEHSFQGKCLCCLVNMLVQMCWIAPLGLGSPRKWLCLWRCSLKNTMLCCSLGEMLFIKINVLNYPIGLCFLGKCFSSKINALNYSMELCPLGKCFSLR
jgi:hypothetical protein